MTQPLAALPFGFGRWTVREDYWLDIQKFDVPDVGKFINFPIRGVASEDITGAQLDLHERGSDIVPQRMMESKVLLQVINEGDVSSGGNVVEKISDLAVAQRVVDELHRIIESNKKMFLKEG